MSLWRGVALSRVLVSAQLSTCSAALVPAEVGPKTSSGELVVAMNESDENGAWGTSVGR